MSRTAIRSSGDRSRARPRPRRRSRHRTTRPCSATRDRALRRGRPRRREAPRNRSCRAARRNGPRRRGTTRARPIPNRSAAGSSSPYPEQRTGSTSALNPSGVASARNTTGTVTMASAAKARCRLAMNAASAPPFLAAVLIIIGAGGQATSIASPIATAGRAENENERQRGRGDENQGGHERPQHHEGALSEEAEDAARRDAQRLGENDQCHRQGRDDFEAFDDQVSHDASRLRGGDACLRFAFGRGALLEPRRHRQEAGAKRNAART